MGMEAAPFLVVGHGFADADPFPVPLPVVLMVGTALVAAGAAVTAQHSTPVPAIARKMGPTVRLVLRILAIVLAVAIVVPATFGPSDVSANPAPRLLFTVGWAGVLVASAVLGPVWPNANPLRWVAAPQPAGVEFYRRVGVWPAVAGLVLFSIAEQVADPSPLVVLLTVGTYVLAMGIGGLTYGFGWFRAADPVEVASRLVGRLAPIGRESRRVTARRTRAGVAATGTVPGTAAFLGVLIGVNLFDAMEPSGSVASRLGVFLLVAGVTALAATVSARPAYLAPALIPAAVAHLAAHYLAPLLVDTQIAVIQASDPLGLGWDIFGIAGAEPNATPIPILAAQTVQLVVLVAGHALAMITGNDIAARHLGPRQATAALFGLRAAVIASLVAGLYLRVGG